MTWYCEKCDSELIHHDGSSNWECPNPESLVSFQELRRVKRGNLIAYEVKRVVYATVL